MSAFRASVLVAVLLVLVAVYEALLFPWLRDWGATADERHLVLPGDHLDPAGPSLTRAVTVEAPPSVVWAWLLQVGQDRAGFYSNTWLENMTGADIHNADQLRPEWQKRAVRDRVPMARQDLVPADTRDFTNLTIRALEPERMIADLPGRFVLIRLDSGATRLLLREPVPEGTLARLTWDPMHFVMERRMLLGIKERAEGRPVVPPVVAAAARFGWLLAGVAVAVGFLSRRGWLPWMLLPLLAATPAIVFASDPDAALAGFLAVGISLLGALHFGWRWLAVYPLLAAGVLLVLLLTPDAYAAFGLLFDAALVATIWHPWSPQPTPEWRSSCRSSAS